jgi:FkbM family methyltransferase
MSRTCLCFSRTCLGCGASCLELSILTLRDGRSFRVRSDSEDAKEVVVVSLTHEYPDNVIANLSANDVVVDAGAHVGSFAIHAKLLNPKVRLFAIEPSSESYGLLRENIARNNLTSEIIAEQCALSNHNGQAMLSTVGPPDSWTISATCGRASSTAEAVSCVSLDAFMTHHSLTRIALLKLDTEGSEHLILDESFEKVAVRVDRVVVEYHTRGPVESKACARHQIIAALAGHGYSVCDHNDHSLFATRTEAG